MSSRLEYHREYVRKNKAAVRAKQREWLERNREHRAEYERNRHRRGEYLERMYGITRDDYNRMLEAQGGVCAVCNKAAAADMHYGKLLVDHDHATGKVRALLCNLCNQGLGSFRDDPALLEKAVEYLNRHKEK